LHQQRWQPYLGVDRLGAWEDLLFGWFVAGRQIDVCQQAIAFDRKTS